VDNARQIVLDTETTGLEPGAGHRIVEIACLELVGRTLTGEQFHRYVNPGRKREPRAMEVQALSDAFLADKPRFGEIREHLGEFVRGAEVIIHNAEFDLAFLLGNQRISERSLRLRSLHEAGARIVLSSDYDVGDLSPFSGMRRALTRGDQSLPDLETAIRPYTLEAAYLMRQENTTGSIEVGKRADLIVLDRNPFEISAHQLDQVRVEVTLVDGEVVHGEDQSTAGGDPVFADSFETGDLSRWSLVIPD